MATNEVEDKLKELVVDLLNRRDWVGARNLLDAIVLIAVPSNTVTSNQVAPEGEVPVEAKTDNPNEDAEFQRRFGKTPTNSSTN